MFLDIAIVLLLIAFNGYLAMSELAVVSARRARLQRLTREHRGASVAMALAEEPGRFLSTVQIGITLIGVLAGAFSGATIAGKIGTWLQDYPSVAQYGHTIGLIVVVGAITYLSLIFGELVPKRLALANPERVAARVARPMRALSIAAGPLVSTLTWSSNAVLRLFGLRRDRQSQVTEEEIRHVIEEGVVAGAIERSERNMLNRVFRLGDKLVRDIMTPRPQLVWLDADAGLSENLARLRSAPHSRLPVMSGEHEEVVGIVQVKDLARQIGSNADVDLFAGMREPLFIPETTRALKLLDLFKSTDLHLALVVDEYGELQGLVTPNDILEAILGEVPQQGSEDEPDIVQRSDGSWLIDGLTPADTLKDLLALERLPGEAEHDYTTVAGMLISCFNRIPETGDIFEWQGFRFEVVDLDGRRIDKILVVPPSTAAGEVLPE